MRCGFSGQFEWVIGADGKAVTTGKSYPIVRFLEIEKSPNQISSCDRRTP